MTANELKPMDSKYNLDTNIVNKFTCYWRFLVWDGELPKHIHF